jgi:four helix bundle protein
MFGIENLIVWREACALAAKIEIAVLKMKGVNARSNASQLVRAADSIASNIAEGYGRGVTVDGLRYFRTAKSEADEVENHLRRAKLTHRLGLELLEDLIDHTIRVRFLILRYAASIERRIPAMKARKSAAKSRKPRSEKDLGDGAG